MFTLLHNAYFYTQESLQSLEETFQQYDSICDKIIEELHAVSSDHKEDERLGALKDKFVDINNLSNWMIETVYDNPNASMYQYAAQKNEEQRCVKRQKNDIKEI